MDLREQRSEHRATFALGKENSTYLVYTRLGGTVTVKLPPGKYSVTTKQLVELASAVPGPYEARSTVQIGDPDSEFRVILRSAYD